MNYYKILNYLLGIFSMTLLLCCGTGPQARTEPDCFQTGKASYYAQKFHGRKTASGERYDKNALTAAHPSLPFGTLVMVENLQNNRKVTVRINDRGPFVKGRVIDLSYTAAKKLKMVRQGVVRVRLCFLE